MTDPRPAPSVSGRVAQGALGALVVAPALVLVAATVAPRLSISAAAGDAFVFLGGVVASLGALALAAPARLRLGPSLGLLGACIGALVITRFSSGPARVALLDLALVAAAHVVGGAIGWRIQHPGHLMPACIIAAAADVASVVHPSGPSHAIAASDTALSLLAIHFPVPGASAAAPVLGAGDLVFSALLFACARAHGIGVARVAGAVLLGALAAGALSLGLAAPVPALVPIAVAVPALVPEARRLRREDRRTTAFAVAVAVGVVVGVVAQRL